MRITVDFSSEIIEARGNKTIFFECWGKKTEVWHRAKFAVNILLLRCK